MFTCLTLTFLNRSGNPATGSWQHLEKIQCMFSRELFFIYGILYKQRTAGWNSQLYNHDRDTKANPKYKPIPISEGRMSMIGRAYVCKGLPGMFINKTASHSESHKLAPLKSPI